MREYYALHRAAVRVILVALAADAVCGVLFSFAQRLPLWHGMYVALANAVTFGGDVPPSTPLGYAVNTIECLFVIPLFAATLSLFTSRLTGEHVKQHVQDAKEDIKSHVTTAVAK